MYQHLLGLEGIASLRSFTGELGEPRAAEEDAHHGPPDREFVAALLAGRGHHVIGVDSTPDMLARARDRVPGGAFLLGGLHQLPVTGDAVDLVVCSLARTRVPVLRPGFAEFARVLRPGGHLVLSDLHPERVARGVVPTTPSAAEPSPGPSAPVGPREPCSSGTSSRPLPAPEPTTPLLAGPSDAL
ncbi:class I SAM-dependent methyltransferase [Streptomyces spectabilis]|nr:methyltransferase domain-containing protein [Streptomyces spectabilis]MCI3900397.1 methyltransferase domain-containing protein [Streptomyces spectabilis]QEV64448.1 methyltransferase domain-containing protein [Streptomyces spectabilis]GGV09947.1 hypothetical protein GCM10010245_18720 [Streptomyces spectabilis]